MGIYYCRKCAVAIGEISEEFPIPDNLIGTEYKLEKFVKHNFPTEFEEIHSIFKEPNLLKYSQYVINTSASGCLEIDDHGRKNLIFVAGETTGYTLVNGEIFRPDDAVRLVFYKDTNKIHAFSTSGSVIPKLCSRCGCPIVF